jgi:translation initiation factor IF-1
MEKHSNYSPSRLSRIIACPGSVDLIESLLSTETIKFTSPSTDAAHGTMLHEVIDNYYSIDTGKRNESALRDLDLDDKALIEDATDYLEAIIKSKGHDGMLMKAENFINLESWGLPDIWGTFDFSIIDPFKRHVDIIDWKFGAGITVYAEENPQLLAYAAGIVKYPSSIQNITLHVVQPALDHYDTWSLSANELYDWVHGTLAIAIGKCHGSGVDKFVPGKSQCRWCEAKNHCSARITFAQETAIKLFNAKEKLATCPTIEDLVELVEMAPLVEDAIKSIRVYLQRELENGHKVPGLKLVRGKANRVWVNENDVITWLAKNTSIEELFTSKLRSPSQLEKEDRSLKKSEGFKKTL